MNNYDLQSIYFDLRITSITFFILGFLFLLYFTDFKKEKRENLKSESFLKENSALLSYSFFFFSFYILLYIFSFNIYYFSIISFIISFCIYYGLLSISIFNKPKSIRKQLKYLSLLFLYFSSIFGILDIFLNGTNLVILGILFYSIIFNILFFKNFKNYVSLLFSVLILFYVFYILYFEFFDY
ncbi:hypothetical protein A9Q91_06160 [Candidatus Gracilibacteria bacterium 28_42_T64]|nr:hypothetical protein A9Q91_06160 [Candidatus Gracilibacteria bacterium 28_42_T64]